MKITNDSEEAQLTDTLGMTGEEFETWKETVQMDVIRQASHTQNWISEPGSLPSRS